MLALALVGAGGRSSLADTVDASLSTVVSGRSDPRDGEVHTVVPIYELVAIRGEGIGNPWVEDLGFVLSGWGRVDSGDPADGRTETGDLDVAYAEGSLWEHRVSFRAGRQLVPGAVARNLHMDGLHARAVVWRGLGVEAHGGVPVTRRFELDRGDAVAGGRLFWRGSANSELGLSFIRVDDGGSVTRQDVGADARYRVTRRLDLSGFGALSLLEQRLAEVDVGVEWRPAGKLWLRADYRRTAPDLFLPRTSIMTVFAEQSRDEAGVDLTVWARSRVRLNARGDVLVVEDRVGYTAESRITLFPTAAMTTRLAGEVQRLAAIDNGFARARVTAFHELTDRLDLSLDGAVYRLDEPINGQRTSLTATAGATLTVGEHWQASLAGVAGVTPFLSRRFEGMAKLVYRPTHSVREATR